MPTWIEHQGRRILRLDLHELPLDRYAAEVDAALQMILDSKPEPNSVLVLACGTQPTGNLEKTGEIWKRFQAGAKGLTRAQAVVGLSGFKRVVARLVLRDLYFATSEDDARAWLIKQ